MVTTFINKEDGSQVVEYALIVAFISIGLVLALQPLTSDSFSDFVTRVACFLSIATCA